MTLKTFECLNEKLQKDHKKYNPKPNTQGQINIDLKSLHFTPFPTQKHRLPNDNNTPNSKLQPEPKL